MPYPPISVLDLAFVAEGSDAAQALNNSRDLAQHAERWGYHRFWLAEHHNMIGIASAATSVVIGHVAAGTSTIRVGAGGIMLPNHAPLLIAEQFGTLEALFPGRIDLGLGRAPGTDQRTMRALRRQAGSADTFPDDVQELQAYFAAPRPGQHIQSVPGAGLEVPLWILGSSLFGAQLAAGLGLPYAFASHFAPAALVPALQTYHNNFSPSRQLDQPRAMVAINVCAADSDAEARRLFTSAQQQFTQLIRGSPGKLPPPIDSIDTFWNAQERNHVSKTLEYSLVGSIDTVREGLQRITSLTAADEFIVATAIHDHDARLRSYELLAQIMADG